MRTAAGMTVLLAWSAGWLYAIHASGKVIGATSLEMKLMAGEGLIAGVGAMVILMLMRAEER